jgi:hypothetical protein
MGIESGMLLHEPCAGLLSLALAAFNAELVTADIIALSTAALQYFLPARSMIWHTESGVLPHWRR